MLGTREAPLALGVTKSSPEENEATAAAIDMLHPVLVEMFQVHGGKPALQALASELVTQLVDHCGKAGAEKVLGQCLNGVPLVAELRAAGSQGSRA